MGTASAKGKSASTRSSRYPKNRLRGLCSSRTRRVRATGLPSYGPRWGKRFVYDGAASDQRYPGQYFDSETGLHQNHFRDYDPKTGRYIQADPIGLAGGLNLYTYVGGNPVRYNDPAGLLGPALLGVPVLLGGISAETGAAILGSLLALGTGAGAGATYDPNVIALPGDMPFSWDSPNEKSPPAPIALNSPSECKDKKNDDCDQEWREAREICKQLIYEQLQQQAGRRKKRSVTGVTGGFTDVEKCARGLVSERCGGNRVRR